ncbi:MAG: cytochrome c oxidase subunit II [Terrimicrobiaceae bacterium]|nr:cytochrome c oxidase subunit II [Terrimicrobiaceae bacterium]
MSGVVRRNPMAGRLMHGVLRAAAVAMVFLAGEVPLASAQSPGEMRRVTDMFQPLSKPAEMIHESAVLVLLITAGIFAAVTGILIFVVWKFRRRGPEDDLKEPPQIYGSSHIELAWTVVPILITFVLILVTSRTIGDIQNAELPEGALRVRIVGHQWWWEVHYPDLGIVTANEIHVPVSSRDPGQRRPTEIFLESADVIHSFWVPQLAGKTDLVPNRKNRTWIEPYATGTFFGNCAEYCGTQHANMLLRVIVHEPAEFEKWVQVMKRPPPVPESGIAAQGRRDFYATACINCHRVDGTVAEGVFGPDLTKLMTRQTIGAGVADLTPENLRAWVRNPQDLKVGCLMPDMKLAEEQVDSITAYLLTLE